MGEIAQRVHDQQDGPAVLVAKYAPQLGGVLPRHVGQDLFVQMAIGMLDSDLEMAHAARVNPQSFLRELRECARLGHMPGTEEAALVVFKTKAAPGGYEFTLIEQYQGEIERMYRAGQVTSVHCDVVRENDHFLWRRNRMLLPEHEFDPLADETERGVLRGVYAYARLRSGDISEVIVMPKSEVMKHKAMAKTMKFWEGPFEPSMWKKTAVHELAKWVATSSEWLTGVTLPENSTPSAAQQQLAVPAPALEPPPPDWSDYANPQQLHQLNELLDALGADGSKEERLRICEALAERELTGERYTGRSSGNLQRGEAVRLIARLQSCSSDPAKLAELLDAELPDGEPGS